MRDTHICCISATIKPISQLVACPSNRTWNQFCLRPSAPRTRHKGTRRVPKFELVWLCHASKSRDESESKEKPENKWWRQKKKVLYFLRGQKTALSCCSASLSKRPSSAQIQPFYRNVSQMVFFGGGRGLCLHEYTKIRNLNFGSSFEKYLFCGWKHCLHEDKGPKNKLKNTLLKEFFFNVWTLVTVHPYGSWSCLTLAV